MIRVWPVCKEWNRKLGRAFDYKLQRARCPDIVHTAGDVDPRVTRRCPFDRDVSITCKMPCRCAPGTGLNVPLLLQIPRGTSADCWDYPTCTTQGNSSSPVGIQAVVCESNTAMNLAVTPPVLMSSQLESPYRCSLPLHPRCEAPQGWASAVYPHQGNTFKYVHGARLQYQPDWR